MRLLRACFAVATFALAATLTPAAHAQSDADKAAARQLATQGGQALSANRYAEALDLVTRAESMFHAPTHLSMIARAQVGLGHLVAAREAYIKLSREELAPNAPPAFRAAVDDARAQLPAIEGRIANLRIVVRGAEGRAVALKLDEQPLPNALIGVYAPVDPGKHDVSISAGGPPAHTSIELGAGDRKDLILDAPPGAGAVGATGGQQGGFAAEEPAANGGFFTPMRIAGVAVGAAGVGGAVVGAIFLAGRFSAKSAGDDAFAKCNPGCTQAEIATIGQHDTDAAHKGTIAAIALPVGGAAIVAGVTLIVLGKPSGAPQATGTVRVSPYFTGQSAGFTGTF